MDEARKCPNCSAILKRLDERFCGFCGTEVPVVVAASSSRGGDRAARFAELSEHPSLPDLMRREPEDGWVTSAFGFQVVFGIVFTAIALPVGLVFLVTIIGAPFSVIPFGLAALGVWFVVDARRKQARYRAASLRREPALVVGERTRVSGGGKNSSASTTYFVTLETADGERTEYRTRGSIVGEVTEGDMGIAYVRDTHLLDFARIPV